MLCVLGYLWVWLLEFMEGVGGILWHGEFNNSLIIVFTFYFYSTVQATCTINIHRVTFYYGLYEIILILFSNIFYSKIISNQ